MAMRHGRSHNSANALQRYSSFSIDISESIEQCILDNMATATGLMSL
jgi:hypothetical protein